MIKLAVGNALTVSDEVTGFVLALVRRVDLPHVAGWTVGASQFMMAVSSGLR